MEVKLQAKNHGYETDDLVVCVKNPQTDERRKLLGQVKLSISFTNGNDELAEVLAAAWRDFNNASLFDRTKDSIALMVGPVSAADARNVQWLLEQARHTSNADEFFENVRRGKFGPAKAKAKLAAFSFHLRNANDEKDLTEQQLYEFLSRFHLLVYDLDSEVRVVLSLIHSHISQFDRHRPERLWARVVEIVRDWNQSAGTITFDRLPEDLRDAFKLREIAYIPPEFALIQQTIQSPLDWNQHRFATELARWNLIGEWHEGQDGDLAAVSSVLREESSTWVPKARELLNETHPPLLLKDGSWKVTERDAMWRALGTRLFDDDLDRFKDVAVQVLAGPDPDFKWESGKVPVRSTVLRRGIANGLAILGSYPGALTHCSRSKASDTARQVVQQILSEADRETWTRVGTSLPSLAEAAPEEFLDVVEATLSRTPCPLVDMSDPLSGRNHQVGLLSALELLAWDADRLIRVCVALAGLAACDPGETGGDGPNDSLAAILLPWRPQTEAPLQRRIAAVSTVLSEQSAVGWKLLMRLLPGGQALTTATHRPRWHAVVEGVGNHVTRTEYLQEVSQYAEFAISTAGHDPAKLGELVDRLDQFPRLALDQFVQVLSGETLGGLDGPARLHLWRRLIVLIAKHRSFADAEWALKPDVLAPIEQLANALAPSEPQSKYRHLFSEDATDTYVGDGDGSEDVDSLWSRRKIAVDEILSQGLPAIVEFAADVQHPDQVGVALGAGAGAAMDRALLPALLRSGNPKHALLARGYAWRRYNELGAPWLEGVDWLTWRAVDIGAFLTFLPFAKDVWARTDQAPSLARREYWANVTARPFQAHADDLFFAVERLLEFERPYQAIECLDWMRWRKLAIDVHQCVRALRAAGAKPQRASRGYKVGKLISFLQASGAVPHEELATLEWMWLKVFDRNGGIVPRALEQDLANRPEYFHKLIQLAYQSTTSNESATVPPSELRANASCAYDLLRQWQLVPGMQSNGFFDGDRFNDWLNSAKATCSESGHLNVAFSVLGRVLQHAPADSDGLWIHRTVAAALNAADAQRMREGFSIALRNSRGGYDVNPSGADERALAQSYRQKASDVDNAGFSRLATTLRRLAERYEREAEEVVAEYGAWANQ